LQPKRLATTKNNYDMRKDTISIVCQGSKEYETPTMSVVVLQGRHLLLTASGERQGVSATMSGYEADSEGGFSDN